jgi:hypothetical protein
VVHLHARAGIIDAERLRLNLDAYKPIARLFGNIDTPQRTPPQIRRARDEVKGNM